MSLARAVPAPWDPPSPPASEPQALHVSSLEPQALQASTLDPQDWDAFRRLVHRAVDDMLDGMQDPQRGPVWTPPADLSGLAAVEPQGSRPPEAVYEDFRTGILPGLLGNTHPRFWGWVHGSGTPVGALAEFLSGAVNANLGGRDHAPVHLERLVIERFRARLGFPESASGLLVTGTSMATLLALAVARQAALPETGRRWGMARGAPVLTGYCSREAHGSAAKAFELLGLGSAQLRHVPVDGDGRMVIPALEEAIAKDRERDRLPFVVIASAGTVNVGAFDDLREVRRVCTERRLWMHVDGAFGAMARLAPGARGLTAGMEDADSLAFDFHKWFHVPYDAGCLIVRDREIHEATFGGRRPYLAATEEGPGGGEPWFCDYGVELSRGFRALKVWFTLETHGWDRMGEMVQKNCDQAAWLADRVDAEPALERAAPVPLNIVCLRYRGRGGHDRATEDRLTLDLLHRIQTRGIAVPSLTRLDDRPVIRVCITNHRTDQGDLEAFVEALLREGAALEAGL